VGFGKGRSGSDGEVGTRQHGGNGVDGRMEHDFVLRGRKFGETREGVDRTLVRWAVSDRLAAL